MKNLKYVLVLLLAFFACGTVSNALSTLPDEITTDKFDVLPETEDYLENYPVIFKTAENQKYYVYCMNQYAKYDGGITFSKTDTVDPGFKYILKNRPKTADKEKDFYITQMAVWYYQDYLNRNNPDEKLSIPSQVVKYFLLRADDKISKKEEAEIAEKGQEKFDEISDICKKIYSLYEGAKNYKEMVRSFSFREGDVTFTKEGEYYVSSEIIVDKQNIGNIKYQLANAPANTTVSETENGVIVKVPVSSVTKTVEFKLTADATYTKEDAYYYFYNNTYQRILFQELLETEVVLSDVKAMKIVVEKPEIKEYQVKISKTDITQSKEIAGATLVVKNEKGEVLEKFVSTNEAHYITLAPGKYSLTETLAPKGYKLSTTTIEFMLATNGTVYVKENGSYVSVDRVVMINELIDVVAINKVDKDTNKLVSGAKLTIKDTNGNTVKTFVTNGQTYYIELDPGYYTIKELEAPKGYVLSKDVIYFYLGLDGTLKIKNESGKYVESSKITFFNTKIVEKEVIVPATGLNSYTTLIGIVLLASGIICVKKFNKEY